MRLVGYDYATGNGENKSPVVTVGSGGGFLKNPVSIDKTDRDDFQNARSYWLRFDRSVGRGEHVQFSCFWLPRKRLLVLSVTELRRNTNVR